MNENILHQIANTLYINTQRVKFFGLLQGRLGIAIFFYHYARYTGNKAYSDFSDEYIEFIHDKLGEAKPEMFADGLSGVGWGLDYIIKNGFVEADDNMFEDIDVAVSKLDIPMFLKEMELPLPLFSKGLYFLQRNNNPMLSATIQQIVAFFQKYPAQHMPGMYLNSIIYVLVTCSRLNIESEICNQILEMLFTVSKQNLTNNNYSAEACILLRKTINWMPEAHFPMWKALLNDMDLSKEAIHTYWIDFLFFNKERTVYDQMNLFQFLVSALEQLNYENISIYNGLTGIGLGLLINVDNIDIR